MSSEWKPRYLVQKAPGVGGDPIPEDEPCLVIRAQDIMALATLRTYIEYYSIGRPWDYAVVVDLEAHLQALIDWQADHPDKVKWADRETPGNQSERILRALS